MKKKLAIQSMHLIKRFLIYILLFLITFTVIMICGGLFREYDSNYYYVAIFILAFLIPQYVYGIIFLKTELIIKLVAPFISTIVSYGSMLIVQTKFFDINNFEIVFSFVLFLSIVLPWETTYQMLKFRERHEIKKTNFEN